ncbi:MAG: ABC transporter ATP-binding protein [Actinobacteria bacterium]|nr:ABC transporter ATP-binding protein [Actinomycetota bacterium]
MSVVVSLRDASKRFGDTLAVDRLTLDVETGELLTLVGPSGCGKSTVLRVVAGLLEPDTGTVSIDGRVVAGEGHWVPAERRRVGIVFQDDALFPHLTVAQNVAFGLGRRGVTRQRGRVDDVLELVEMAGFAERYPHELSGGEKQRIALARALAPEPEVLLLDEPFSDLDRNLRLQVRAETIRVLREVGATAVFVTHDQEEALSVGDRVVVMRAGRTEQVDHPAVVFHAPTNRFVATFMGDADFLPGEVAGGRLVTEAGETAAPSTAHDGDQLHVMSRPHELSFVADPDGTGHVLDREFQGGFVVYRIRLASGLVVRCLRPHTEDHPPGTSVKVFMDHGHEPTVFRGEVAVSSADHAPGSPRP